MQHAHRATQTVLLGRAHVQQLHPARDHRLQRLDFDTRRNERHARLVGLGRQGLGQVRQRHRVNCVGLGQVPHAAGELARRARINHRYGQAMTQQESRQRPLQPTGGFDHDQTNAAVFERFKQRLKSRLIVGRAVRVAHTVQRPFQRFLRYVHADEVQRGRFTSSSVCHIPSLHYAKFIQVTVRAWRQTQAPARPHALGRAASSKGERAVQALAN